MKRNSFNLDVLSLLAGTLIGAGAVLAKTNFDKRYPEKTLGQARVNRALNKALRKARNGQPISLGTEHRYVIFSDHHKGGNNEADAFRGAKDNYLAALDHYFERDFTLIVLGDAEELLEERFEKVIDSYQDVLESEARFYPQRHFRLPGNHDVYWESQDFVNRHLGNYFPGIQFPGGLVLEYEDDDGIKGDIFMTHGHQGTLDADVFSFFPPLVLPLYRSLQIITGMGEAKPSDDACLRAEHDTRMYRWASRQEGLILISGHTHRPVWSSLTHLEKLVMQLHALLALPPDQRPDGFQELVKQLQNEIKERAEKYPPCTDTIKTRPCYFNTGCCSFRDGDITGIEIVDGQMVLVKWGMESDVDARVELEKMPLAEIVAML